MSDAIIALGTFIEIDLNTTGAFAGTEVAEVKRIGGPSRDKQLHDVTHLRSPDRYREWKSGLKDGGELTLEVNFLPANASHDLLFSAFEATTPQRYRVTYPDGETTLFTGELFNITEDKAFDGILTGTIQIKVTGSIPTP